jgi:hypothetical protein
LGMAFKSMEFFFFGKYTFLPTDFLQSVLVK